MKHATVFSVIRRLQLPQCGVSKLEKDASYPGLENITKLATVVEGRAAELLRISTGPRLRFGKAKPCRDTQCRY